MPLISRESFLKVPAFALSIAGLGLGTLFISVSASAQTPTPGGVLVFGREGESVSLDPGKETDGASLNVTDNIFDTLVQFKSGSTEIEPGLATSWEISADNLQYTFKLRTGVKFHDGTDFNADAVLFSFLRQHDPKHEAFGFAKTWEYWDAMDMKNLVKSIEKVDANTVKITLTKPEAPFMANLAMSFAGIVSPTAVRKFKEEFAKNPVGTGPFKFATWNKNEKIILDGNKTYWGGKPYLDKVIFKTLPDSAARLNAFLAKEVHLMNLPSAEQISTIKSRRADAKILEKEGMNVGYLAFNTSKKPFDNPKVRQAMNMAVNKDAIIKGIYGGMGTAAVNPIPPSIWSYNTSIKPYTYDVKKAKELLKEAGFPNGFKAELWTLPVSRPSIPNGKKVGEAMQADLKAIGVEVTLSTKEWATYLDQTKKGEHQMAMMNWTGDNGDPDNFFYTLLSGDNIKPPAQNIAFYKNDSVDKLFKEAKAKSDQKVRTELYKQAQDLIHKDAPWIPIAYGRDMMPMDGKVNGFVLDPTGSRRFAKVWLSK